MIKLTREDEYVDQFRKYKVIVDDDYLGDINAGETKCFEVAPGKHIIYLKIDWCRSNKLDFYILENEIIEFNCGSSVNRCKISLNFIYITLLKNDYLWLETRNRVNL